MNFDDLLKGTVTQINRIEVVEFLLHYYRIDANLDKVRTWIGSIENDDLRDCPLFYAWPKTPDLVELFPYNDHLCRTIERLYESNDLPSLSYILVKWGDLPLIVLSSPLQDVTTLFIDLSPLTKPMDSSKQSLKPSAEKKEEKKNEETDVNMLYFHLFVATCIAAFTAYALYCRK